MRIAEWLLRRTGVIEREKVTIETKPSPALRRLDAAQRMAERGIVRADRATAHVYQQTPSWEELYLGQRR
jgi:hypothetical protein